MKKRLSSIISFLITLTSILIIVVTIYISKNYGNYFKEILYYALYGLESAGGNALASGIKSSIIPFVILSIYFLMPIIGFIKYKINIDIKIWKLNIKLNLPFKHKILYSIGTLIIAILFVFITFDINGFIKDIKTEATLYSDNYVDGKELELIFPEQKQNLILIFAESLETTFISKDNGGEWKQEIIPELENIALNNINFSHNDKVGGAIVATGTSWTSSGMVAQTAGINMNVFQDQNTRNNYKSNKFLNGAYTLGDVLEENGYNQELIIGSDADFGGRKQYFSNHGNFKIFDYNYAKDQGLIDYYIWWGYEDYKMFDFAKEELKELSSKEEPFNLVLLTADTHFENGCHDCVREKNIIKQFDTQYENVYASSSLEISQFIEWLQKQEYYDNTTIVIVGDHLSMQNSFFTDKEVNQDNRRVYNAIINSKLEATNTKNREFSTMDIYPTILASMGVEIPGDRIGLGTNLYSDKPTIYEELGVERVQKELGQNSSFYNFNILEEDYGLILN